MKSLGFPQIFQGNVSKTVSDLNATKQNLILLMNTPKGSTFGDPGFGTSLVKFTFQPNSIMIKDLIIDEVYQAIGAFMPQIVVNRQNIHVDNNKALARLDVTVRGKNIANQEIDTYQLALMSNK